MNSLQLFLLFIWQLPQHLVALLFWGALRLVGKIVKRCEPTKPISFGLTIIRIKIKHFGLSLGDYIFLGIIDSENNTDGNTFLHERGHTRQSHHFGPLYLLIVGLPSITRNIYSRIKHKDSKWYYSAWPENNADKLGGVVRT
jgi:hypothetical protein